jgi:hypothetical protein
LTGQLRRLRRRFLKYSFTAMPSVVFQNSVSCQKCRRVQFSNSYTSHQAKDYEPHNMPHHRYAGTDSFVNLAHPHQSHPTTPSGQIGQENQGPLSPHLARNRGPLTHILVSDTQPSMHGSPAPRLPSSGPTSFGPASADHESGMGLSSHESANGGAEGAKPVDFLHWDGLVRLKEGEP